MTTETYEIIAAGLRTLGIHRPDYHTHSVEYAEQCLDKCHDLHVRTTNFDEAYVLADFITKWRRIISKLKQTWGQLDGRKQSKGRDQRKHSKAQESSELRQRMKGRKGK